MPKAKIELPDGTVITIEGTQEEVTELLAYYQAKSPQKTKQTPPPNAEKTKTDPDESSVNYTQIINLVKNVDEAEEIERYILDRTSQVDRSLLPLYIVHQYLDNSLSLSSGDISKITTDLGIPISVANASRTLSGTASRYVIGDKVRKKGRTIKYKLSRRGVKYLKSVISGSSDEN
ncbi:MAG: hypothetical protein DWQ07_22125 [Chloroflexi bacterium]|nr:MAG: hypothetical protein DWQ07_22125 [Chloroflexota bacterium]MBL1196347.1 hypothetical protein [Chloroflexota bacterium]NOH13642.1 hypothetical protein [Chloroflexota bacterium]